MASLADVYITLRADRSPAARARMRADIEELTRNATIRVSPTLDLTNFRAQWRIFAAVYLRDHVINIRPDLDENLLRLLIARMGSAGDRGGRAFGGNASRGASAGLTSMAGQIRLLAVRTALWGSAIFSLLPVLAQLSHAAVGLAAAAPQGLLAAVAAVVTLKLALFGVQPAIKLAFDPTNAKAFEAALRKLSPAAQAFVADIQKFRPQLVGLRSAVQDAFFTPFQGSIRELVQNLLPVLRTQLAGLAGNIAINTRQTLDWLASVEGVRRLNVTLGGVRAAFAPLLEQMPALTRSFLILANAATPFVVILSKQLRTWLEWFSAKIAELEASGALTKLFADTLDILKQFVPLVGDSFRLILNVFKTVESGGSTLTGVIGGIIRALADFFATAAGSQALRDLATVLGLVGQAIVSILQPLLPVVGALISALAGPLVRAISTITPALVTLVSELGDVLAPVIAALAPVISDLAGALSLVLAQALVAIAALFIRLEPFIADVAQQIGPILTPIIYALTRALLALLPYFGNLADTLVRLAPDVIALIQQIGPRLIPLMVALTDIVIKLLPFLIAMSPSVLKVADAVVRLIPVINFFIDSTTRMLIIVSNVVSFFGTIPGKFQQFGSVMMAVWNTVTANISARWQWMRDTVFQPLVNFVTVTIPNAFRNGINAVGAWWDRLRAVVRGPVDWVLRNVINRLDSVFNTVANALGIRITPLPTNLGLGAIQGASFASGGRIFDGRLPGAPSVVDNMLARGPNGPLALATGEFVVNAESTKIWLPVLEWINRRNRALPGGDEDTAGHYQTGGIIGNLGALVGAFADPVGWVKKQLAGLIGSIPGGGFMRELMVAAGNKLMNGLASWVQSHLFAGGAAGIAGNASVGFPPWPSSPAAQRGDSGVWRSIVALIRSTGPISGTFGNAYRPGDPLWHGCVPMDTKILTRRGWITRDEIVVGEDETVGYDSATGKNEWTLIVGVVEYDDAELWTLQNKWFKAEVTPGHKWLVDDPKTVQTETTCTECGRDFATGRGMTTHRGHVHKVYTSRALRYVEDLVETRHLRQDARIHVSKPANLGDELPITDDEAELIGWILADGYMEPYGPTIVQSKPEEVQYLRGFMAKFPCSEYVRKPVGRQTHMIYRWKLAVGYWNDLASRSKASKDDALNFVFNLSASQREAFLRGFLSADGTRDPRTQNERLGYAAFQVSGPVAEAIKVAAYLEGYRPDTKVKTAFDEDRFGTQPLEHIGFRTPIVKGRHLKRVSVRYAKVWCPTTILGTWTARQGEEIFLTGNSGRAVDWMGYNQDALATFLANRRPLELIHRTSRRDYAYTRGVNRGSFNAALMEAHRNHVHIAMALGGLLGRTRHLDQGGWWPSGTLGVNTSGRSEYVASADAMTENNALLRVLIEAVERVAPGVGRELTGSAASLRQMARAY